MISYRLKQIDGLSHITGSSICSVDLFRCWFCCIYCVVPLFSSVCSVDFPVLMCCFLFLCFLFWCSFCFLSFYSNILTFFVQWVINKLLLLLLCKLGKKETFTYFDNQLWFGKTNWINEYDVLLLNLLQRSLKILSQKSILSSYQLSWLKKQKAHILKTWLIFKFKNIKQKEKEGR